MRRLAPPSQRSPETLDLLEEALAILRRSPLADTLLYYVGSVPFVLGLLYFWTDMSHNARAAAHCLEASLGLAGLFVWMKSWHVVWASRLREQLSGRPPTPWTWRRSLQMVLLQTFFQPWYFLLMPIAVLFLVPVPWVHALFQNITVLGDGSEPSFLGLGRRASQQALLWHRQNVFLLCSVGAFGLVILVNLGLILGLLPYLVKMLLGIESVFTRHGGAVFNTTFLAIVAGFTALCLGPCSKILYVLRCFYGESLQSGEDLYAALSRLASRKMLGSLLIAGCLGGSLSAVAWGAEATLPSQRIEQLEQSIEVTLQQREYVWRFPRLASTPDTPADSSPGFLRRTGDTLVDWLKVVGEWLGKLITWWQKLATKSQQPAAQQSSWIAPTRLLWGVVVLAGAILLLWLGYLWYRRQHAVTVSASPPVSTLPMLTEEHIMADALPVQGWWSMAQELMQRGELRLATRAFYLASLAYLAQQHLVTIAAHKSSRDYERELRRRAHTHPHLLNAFAHNARTFERVWYGRYEASPEVLQQFTATYERMQASAQN